MKRFLCFALALVLMTGLLPQTTLSALAYNDTSSLIASGYEYSYAIKPDGTLWTWGRNDVGQLGNGATTGLFVPNPTPVKIMDDVASIAAGGNWQALAIKKDGSLWMWAYDQYGALSDTFLPDKVITTPVHIADDVVSASTGGFHAAAIKTDGSLWTWGLNTSGQLGDGTTIDRYEPVKVLDDAVYVVASSSCTMAIKKDNSLWAWGWNGNGELGEGTVANKLSPVKIMDGVSSVSTVAGTTMAVKTDGTLWAWGLGGCSLYFNNSPQIAPVKIMNGVASVSNGAGCAMLIKKDGSLWAWGDNGYLGDGSAGHDNKNINSPVKIMSGVAQVSSSGGHTLAMKKDGSLWAWGNNGNGEVGDGTTTTRLLPVMIWGSSTDPEPDPEPEIDPEDENHDDIDYDIEDIVITGVTFPYKSGAKPADATPNEDCYINLTNESFGIPNGYIIAAYSTDGGKNWKAGNLTQEAFVKLLDKDLELWLTNSYNSNSKKPNGNGNDPLEIIAFDKINARPNAPNLVVNYAIGAELDGTGDFLLTEKNGTVAVKDDVLIGVADKNGKTVDSLGYGKFYDGASNGISLKGMSDNKVEKTAYFIRSAPIWNGTDYIAAGKSKKITATSVQKATIYKIDYKNEIIKLKKGDAYAFGVGGFTEVTENKMELDVSDCISDRRFIHIKKAATAKKPSTEIQTIIPVSRAGLEASVLTCSNGKITLDKKYEVYNPVMKKWDGVPRVTTDAEFDIRLKATVKVSKNSAYGEAASEAGKIIITYGVCANGKNGITVAEIVT